MDESRDDLLKFAKHFERAQGWLLLDNHAAAAKALRLIPAEFRRRPEVTQFRAELHMAAGQWKRAEPLLRQLRKLHPNEAGFSVSLAFAVRRAKSIAAAEQILLEAHQRFPEEAIICFNLACYAAQQGRLADTRDWLHQASQREQAYRELAKTDTDLTPYWAAVGAGSIAAPW